VITIIPISELFDQYGNYNYTYTDILLHNKSIFDDKGNVHDEVYKAMVKYIVSTPTVRPLSIIVEIVMAVKFSRNTKGNYSAIYMWR
jgi:hypothetical protein